MKDSPNSWRPVSGEESFGAVKAGDRTLTMFAPEDDAAGGDLAEAHPILEQAGEQTRHFNLYHAVSGTVSTIDPETGLVSTIFRPVAVATLGVVDPAGAAGKDLLEREGFIVTENLDRKTFHAIDQLPSTVKGMERMRYGGLPELGAEIAKQGLMDTLLGDGAFTASLDAEDQSNVDDIDLTVNQIVTYHVVSQEFYGGERGQAMVDRLSSQAAEGGGESSGGCARCAGRSRSRGLAS